jgi:hypothetical protein
MRYMMQHINFPFDIYRRDNLIDSEDNMAAYVRVVHIAARAPYLDIYVNDKLAIQSLAYREFTNYIKLPSGTYNIKVYRANNTDFPLADVDIFLAPKSVTTIAAYVQRRRLSLYPVEEIPLISPTEGKSKIRIAQFIENIPPVDVVLSNGTVLYRNVNFKDIKNYIELPIGRYTIILKLADTDINMLYVPNINLKSDKYYTLYLIGLVTNFPPPQMLIPLDGISYLNI